jgi:hypothetical protein
MDLRRKNSKEQKTKGETVKSTFGNSTQYKSPLFLAVVNNTHINH